ncbi:MAG: S-layer homology domain-containing protein [Clostridiales bacterium]|jgi:hypothetical protein|nr:S-layer homology domain-containing protein [Clostridiales bacterium]
MSQRLGAIFALALIVSFAAVTTVFAESPPSATADSMTSSGARFSIKLDVDTNLYSIASYNIYLSESESSLFTASPRIFGKNANGTYSETINGLKSDTTYYYAVSVSKTKKSDGFTLHEQGNAGSFRTLAEPPSASASASYNSLTNVITFKGTVKAGSNDVKEKGFVYSYADAANPSQNMNVISKSDAVVAKGSVSPEFTHIFQPDAGKTECYVYAYVKYEENYIYSAKQRVTITPITSTPSVALISESYASLTSRNFVISVTSDGGAALSDRGVIISRTTVSPTFASSSGYVTSRSAGSGSTGQTSVTATGLSAGVTYYAKAYVKNNAGNYYYSSNYITFKITDNNENVTEKAPSFSAVYISDVTAKTAGVTINVSSRSGSSVTERGAVYSSSKNSSSSLVVGGSGCEKIVMLGDYGKGSALIEGLSASNTYYIRPYSKNSYGYSYGEIERFQTESRDYAPYVKTGLISSSTSSITVEIDVTSDNGGEIIERGVIYSARDNSPILNDSSKKRASGSLGSAQVTITGLSSGETYYVRAYASNAYGVAYGKAHSVTVGSSGYVTTGSASPVSDTSVKISGSHKSLSNVTEVGFVYSASTSSPTVSNDKAVAGYDSGLSFSAIIDRLTSGETYYARAYARASGDYYYGDAVEFTVRASDIAHIRFQTSDGVIVGSQSLNAQPGDIITAYALRPPSGYALTSPNVQVRVASEGETIIIDVSEILSNQPYMESQRNYRFEPERNITRVEIAKMLLALRGGAQSAGSSSYADVPDGYRDKAAVDYVTEAGFMTGYPDGSFKPENVITRAEVAVVCAEVYQLQEAAGKAPFKDCAGHWGEEYVKSAYSAGMIHGFPDGSFRPDKNMTRAEAATLFALAEKRDLKPVGETKFTDVASTHWAYKYIMNAAISSNG